MRTNDAGLEIIKSEEGLRLRAYLCPAGVPTIGYGHTRGVTRADVDARREISEAQALELLRRDLAAVEAEVERLCPPLGENQFSALVSLAFNIGPENFHRSTLLRKLRAEDLGGAAAEFARWDKAWDPATQKLRQLPGLARRRAREAALFVLPDAVPTPPPVQAPPAPGGEAERAQLRGDEPGASGPGPQTTRCDVAVRAKLKVVAVTRFSEPEGAAQVSMRPVHGTEDPADVNKAWSKWTPNGEVTLTINNPEAAKQFEPGDYFFADFTKTSKGG